MPPKTPQGLDHQAERLPYEVGGKNEEPGDPVTGSNLLADYRKELTVAVPTVGAKQRLTDEVYTDRHEYEAEEQQKRKQCNFLLDNLPDRFFFRTHG